MRQLVNTKENINQTSFFFCFSFVFVSRNSDFCFKILTGLISKLLEQLLKLFKADSLQMWEFISHWPHFSKRFHTLEAKKCGGFFFHYHANTKEHQGKFGWHHITDTINLKSLYLKSRILYWKHHVTFIWCQNNSK